MRAIIDNKFIIEVVDSKFLSEDDEIRITYSSKIYPELGEYLKDKFLKKDAFSYKDEMQKCTLLIDGFSFTEKMILADDIENEDIGDIGINNYFYGNSGKDIPLNERKDFVENQAYGKLRFRKV